MNSVSLASPLIRAAEAGFLPDRLIRFGIRRLLAARLRQIGRGSDMEQQARLLDLVGHVDAGPMAHVPELANLQHYELPPEFFRLVLGRRLKYSCCYWPDRVNTLDEAEDAALRVTCERAAIRDGMQILELGCGWGSLSLWMARHYPDSVITAVSNSASQRQYIQARADEAGISNLRVVTADINGFEPDAQFDRVVSVEMFEHVRNHRALLRRIAGWLRPGGLLFVHIFCHRRFAYLFESSGPQDWMAEHFFSGGMMPSEDLLAHYDEHMRLKGHWRWNGLHYAKTCNSWLASMDSQLDLVRPLFVECYGAEQASLWMQRWRLFFMACAELFAFRAGEEWYVAHYLFEAQGSTSKQRPPSKLTSPQTAGEARPPSARERCTP